MRAANYGALRLLHRTINGAFVATACVCVCFQIQYKSASLGLLRYPSGIIISSRGVQPRHALLVALVTQAGGHESSLSPEWRIVATACHAHTHIPRHVAHVFLKQIHSRFSAPIRGRSYTSVEACYDVMNHTSLAENIRNLYILT